MQTLAKLSSFALVSGLVAACSVSSEPGDMDPGIAIDSDGVETAALPPVNAACFTHSANKHIPFVANTSVSYDVTHHPRNDTGCGLYIIDIDNVLGRQVEFAPDGKVPYDLVKGSYEDGCDADVRQYAFGWQVYPPKWVKFWEHSEYDYFYAPVCKGVSPAWTKTLDMSPYTKIRLLVKADYTGWDGKTGYAPTTVPVEFGD